MIILSDRQRQAFGGSVAIPKNYTVFDSKITSPWKLELLSDTSFYESPLEASRSTKSEVKYVAPKGAVVTVRGHGGTEDDMIAEVYIPGVGNFYAIWEINGNTHELDFRETKVLVAPSPSIPVTGDSEVTLYVNTAELNIRKSPSTEAEIIGKLQKGSPVIGLFGQKIDGIPSPLGSDGKEIKDFSKDKTVWLAIKSGGWVAAKYKGSQYLSPKKNSSSSSKPKSSGKGAGYDKLNETIQKDLARRYGIEDSETGFDFGGNAKIILVGLAVALLVYSFTATRSERESERLAYI